MATRIGRQIKQLRHSIWNVLKRLIRLELYSKRTSFLIEQTVPGTAGQQ